MFWYYKFLTNLGNTIIERSDSSFILQPNEGQLHSNYFIPVTQPLYLYRVSGSSVIINTENNITAYLATINNGDDNLTTKSVFNQYTGTTAPNTYQSKASIIVLTGTTLPSKFATKIFVTGITSSLVEKTIFTGYTATTNNKINNKLSILTFISYTGNTGNVSIGKFNTYTGSTTSILNNKLDKNAFTDYSATTKSNFNIYSGITITHTDLFNHTLNGGHISGGTLQPIGGINFLILPGSGLVRDNNGKIYKITWNTLNGVTIVGGDNFISIDYTGSIVITSTYGASDNVRLGYIRTNSINSTVIGYSSLKTTLTNLNYNQTNFIRSTIGSLIEDGCAISFQFSPNQLKLVRSNGTIWSQFNRIVLSESSGFTKIYNTSDNSFVINSSQPNTVDVTSWNDSTKPMVNALVTMTNGYWKKDMIFITPEGQMFYIYGTAEYSTKEQAQDAPIPLVPDNIKNQVLRLSTFVIQKSTTGITESFDIRPIFSRIFGGSISSAPLNVIDHGDLIGLSDDDHLQYLTDVRADARYQGQINSKLLVSIFNAYTGSTDGNRPFSDARPLLYQEGDNTATVTFLASNVPSETNINLISPSIDGTLLVDAESYSDPSWLTNLDWGKIFNTPNTLSGYGIGDAFYNGGVTTLSDDTTITGAHGLNLNVSGLAIGVTSFGISANNSESAILNAGGNLILFAEDDLKLQGHNSIQLNAGIDGIIWGIVSEDSGATATMSVFDSVFNDVNIFVKPKGIGAFGLRGNSEFESTQFRMYEGSYSGARYIGFKTPSLTPSQLESTQHEYTWPSSFTEGVLKHDGSGSLSWAGFDAYNGITFDGNYFSLGGNLSTNTIIDLSGRTFTFNTSDGNGHLSFGNSNILGGVYTGAFGVGHTVTGRTSFAFGVSNRVYGGGSYAFGNSGLVTGLYSFVAGDSNYAIGSYAAAFGSHNNVAADYAFAIGNNTNASGVASFAGGRTNGSGQPINVKGVGAFGFYTTTNAQNATHGALATGSVILGGQDHNITTGNTRAVILGGNSIKLTGSTYIDHVVVPNLVIFTTPSAGGTSDILTWNSSTKKIGKVTQASITGTITGATNGLRLSGGGKKTALGGILSGSTTLGLGSNNLVFTGTTGTLRYGSNLSANYNIRSLIDVGYVTGITSTLQTKSAFNTYTGTTEPATYLTKSIYNTYTGTTAPNLYISGATNGLTKQGRKVKLGGIITGATTIGLGANNITFTASTGTIRYGGNYSANYNVRSLTDVGYITGITTTLQLKSSFNTYTGATNSRIITIENNYVTGATSLGGNTLLGTKLGNNLRFKGLIAGSNITITPSSTGITISSTGGGSGSTPTILTTVEVNLGSIPRNSGNFLITGVTTTTGKAVMIQQANGPYTGKGTLDDEAEMDSVIVSGKATNSSTIKCIWKSDTRVKGNFKFNYFISN
jgi:hypothetical protein